MGVTGWAAFGLLFWAFAAPWFEEGWDPKTYDWKADWTPAEPGEAFSVYDGLVTEILFSARDIKLYAYRWGREHEFHILVQRPGRDDIEHCVAGERFTRWFMMTTEMTRGEMLAEPVAARPEDWAVLQLVAYRFVVELPEFRPAAAVVRRRSDHRDGVRDCGSVPDRLGPEFFSLVKQGCAGLGAQP
ncbi:MAG: hypothetical protein K0S81_1358 [Rhodospirillales bacterium]|nr:hypothetical protein [Rhodospirillales bacterium]